MLEDSISQLRKWLAEQELDVYLVAEPHNRSYLCGWFNEDPEGSGMLLISQQEKILLTNYLYIEAARREAVGWQVMMPEGREYTQLIVPLAREHGWKKIGFESKALSYWEYEEISKAGDGIYALIDIEHSFVEELRCVKQPYELEFIRHAIAITDETFEYICKWIQPGMTEKEVLWEIYRYMVNLGADGPAFDACVASGPNSSMPHATVSQRRIKCGEFITIDMGARYKGYCADLTRTICLDEPLEQRMYEIYDAVLDAMRACEIGLYPNITARAADALARNVLIRAGLAEYFIHSTGHSIGLQAHETPKLSPRAPEDMQLPTGSVVTVEPGVYIPGWGGVRIEDCVLVTENGSEVLTKSPTVLVIAR